MNANIIAFKITKPFKLNGEVKAKSFIKIENAKKYSPYICENGNTLVLEYVKTNNKDYILKFAEINTRTEAERLINMNIFFNKNKLEKLDDKNEYYVNDLIGEKIFFSGQEIGCVLGIDNFGSQDLINIQLNSTKKEFYIPFTHDCFTENTNYLELTEFGYNSYILEMKK